MIKTAKIIMRNGANIDVEVKCSSEFNELIDNINASTGLFKLNDFCRINCDDISIITFVEEENNEQKS